MLAVSVSRGDTWFEDPAFSEVFRFGRANGRIVSASKDVHYK